MILCLLVFLSGALIECACVFWVHFSERGRAGATALCSMSIALAEVFGIGESIRHGLVTVAYVLGYGLGTYGAVRWKERMLARIHTRDRQ